MEATLPGVVNYFFLFDSFLNGFALFSIDILKKKRYFLTWFN